MTTVASPRPAFPDVAPFPGEPAAIGHNRPPIEDQGVADFNEAIDGHDGLRPRIAALLDSTTRAQATDDETTARCAELIRQIKAVEDVVDRERTTVKAPYLNAGRKIDDAAKTLVSNLSTAKAGVRAKAEAYMRDKLKREQAEQRRIADEQQAERDRLEAIAAAEAVRAAQENRAPDAEIMEAPIAVSVRPVEAAPTSVRSDFGALASARKVKVAVITDWGKAFKSVKGVAAVQEAIQKAVNGLVRAGQTDIPGVEIKDDIGLSVR